MTKYWATSQSARRLPGCLILAWNPILLEQAMVVVIIRQSWYLTSNNDFVIRLPLVSNGREAQDSFQDTSH